MLDFGPNRSGKDYFFKPCRAKKQRWILRPKRSLYQWELYSLDEPRTGGQVSTAGPGAGGQSVFFQSGERLVRLSVAAESPLRLERSQSGVAIFKGEREIARGQLVEPLLHCPEQAYITVSERCIYDCKFCAVPKLKGGVKS